MLENGRRPKTIEVFARQIFADGPAAFQTKSKRTRRTRKIDSLREDGYNEKSAKIVEK